jgi:hypothetical protein
VIGLTRSVSGVMSDEETSNVRVVDLTCSWWR